MRKSEKGLKKVNFPLMGLVSTTIYLVGVIIMPVYLGEGWKVLTINVMLIIVDELASYNAIFKCSTLSPYQIFHSTYHQMMKFTTPHGIGVVKGDLPVACSCYVHSLHCHILKIKEKENLSIKMDEDLREKKSQLMPLEGLKKFKVNKLKKTVQIRASLLGERLMP